MADLDKIRAAVKLWAPRVVAATLGAVVGVSLTLAAIRTVAGFAAGNGNTVMAVALVLALAATNAVIWRMWGQDKAADLRAAHEERDGWHEWASHFGRELTAAREENKRLAAEVERLAPGEVVARLHERMGDGS